MTDKELVQFQISRQVKSLGRTSLVLLENSHQYIKKLESILLEMGLTQYSGSNFIYSKDRKAILDKVGEIDRDLNSFTNAYKIELDRE